ncbi:Lipase_GDSL domain-containing protein [Meloidogyne graminicola]|uniref:Lipase_GDSL domain-containing protein n=1 Tax=Meloidogyne graminicola TaxID=189291 RepID=A0A8S9ZVL7_9BILA|nr:Lipase_GDSL domain-containing protein [Meloidogyne graminicola]
MLTEIHFLQLAFLIIIFMAKYNNGISSTSSNRRTIKTLREVIASTKPNVVLVPNDNKYERESFLVHKPIKKYFNHTGKLSKSDDSSSDSSFENLDDVDDEGFNNERSEDLINSVLSPVKLIDSEQQRPDDIVSIINSVFNNRKTFSCPKIKADLVTGTSTSNLSPEDIGIIAAMGDSLATGIGLWPRADIEFRGAAFPIGGDATIDGLVTVPNILREFIPSNHLHGVSHGMGLRNQLPENQLNVAMEDAGTKSMPEQANELVRRIRLLRDVDTWNTWTLLIITIGTEEICNNCTGPDTKALIKAIDILNRGIHKAFIVLVGPIHISSSFQQQENLMKTRCPCSRQQPDGFMHLLSGKWANAFSEIQSHVEAVKRKTFNALTLPFLTLHSRYPYSLFIPNKPLLNRRGHNYAAKWLWNRLISGPTYNFSKAVLSQDAYFCPSLGCPYFRTPDNFNRCEVLTHPNAELRVSGEKEYEQLETSLSRSRNTEIYLTTLAIMGIAFFSVITFGTIFYKRSKKGPRGRFDVVQGTKRMFIPEYNYKTNFTNRHQPLGDDKVALNLLTSCDVGAGN